ncbi:hypothetical protein [Alkalihalobacillus sp. AL-G]|uniref:hypothetical protein n=1 Tax=Alkalihalobacillus sp. AL-G TaxID=2926399 RepID=UPI00272D87F8|nr:hypothetical protein [Alkalihalobacillus sp. AL-G]WLD94543.1 hypothetical protein MOJ78_06580 [Alkalihalobacillus sp. AL-G]
MKELVNYCLGLLACIFSFLGGITFILSDITITILLLLVSLILMLFLFKRFA